MKTWRFCVSIFSWSRSNRKNRTFRWSKSHLIFNEINILHIISWYNMTWYIIICNMIIICIYHTSFIRILFSVFSFSVFFSNFCHIFRMRLIQSSTFCISLIFRIRVIQSFESKHEHFKFEWTKFSKFKDSIFNIEYIISFFSFFLFFIIQLLLIIYTLSSLLFRCINLLICDFNFLKFHTMHFVIIDEIDDQIQTDNDFRQSEIVYTQKWKVQKVVLFFHWQNNELNIDFENTYLLSDDMLLKTNLSCQIWFLSYFFVLILAHVFSSFLNRLFWFKISQSVFKLNFKWANVCECCVSSYLKTIKRQSLQINERFTTLLVMIRETRTLLKYCLYIQNSWKFH